MSTSHTSPLGCASEAVERQSELNKLRYQLELQELELQRRNSELAQVRARLEQCEQALSLRLARALGAPLNWFSPDRQEPDPSRASSSSEPQAFRVRKPRGLVELMRVFFRKLGGPVSFDVRLASLSSAEAELLRSLTERAAQLGGPIIEIGTLIGLTTTRLALWKAPQQKIITVDNYCWNPWLLSADDHCQLASQVLLYLKECGHVEQIRMDKDEYFRSYAGPPPALVFLDADHTYEATRRDIAWARAVKANIISGHDYGHEWPGVMKAVDEAGGPGQLRGTLWALGSGTN